MARNQRFAAGEVDRPRLPVPAARSADPVPTTPLGDLDALNALEDPTEPVTLGASLGEFPADDWDRYEQLAFIAAGGMGEVHKVWDRRLRRTVALKFLEAERPSEPGRFLEEACAQALVEHPAICRVHEIGEVWGKPHTAMQYAAGESLEHAAAAMTLVEQVEVMREVALAVHAAHEAGLVHRDLKPGNVLVERSPCDGRLHPYVTDFGLARALRLGGEGSSRPTPRCARGPSNVVGTPNYMAPESARRGPREPDRRTDAYGLGATLYFLLTGRPPFDGGGPVEILMALHTDEPPRPRRLDPTIPAALEGIVARCLAKDPAAR